jgi:hypothetical protein
MIERKNMLKEILEGRKILGFEIREHGFCSLSLNGGYAVSAETLCRFIGLNGEFISTQDHGQKFGMAEPYDAADKISKAIKGKEIIKANVAEGTWDLTLVVDTGRIEILCNSAGYECYQFNGPDNLIIVGHGGSGNT